MIDLSIIDWILKYGIKNEKGDPIEFINHLFLWDIYLDQSQYLCVVKAAQVGLSTLEVLKNIYDAKHFKMDIIYTLPTDSDVNIFVGGKVNRIIAQNPILLDYTKDKDSVEQKQIGDSMIYFRGTFTQKAAIMVTADRIVNDEEDSSKQDVVKAYEARLQHSKFKQKHVFSHPSTTGTGVDVEWNDSDQKHWFITCGHCQKEQFLSWDLLRKENMSINMVTKQYVCKSCGGILSNKMRAVGKWKAKIARDKEGNVLPKKYSGYWVSLLMCPWVSAEEIVDKYKDPKVSEEHFYNKVLGLPFVGAGNKLTKDLLFQNLTQEIFQPDNTERAVMGVDTGLKLDYVIGNEKGLFYQGDTQDYGELDRHMTRWPKMICIMDAGGDLIGSRKFQEKWRGRVFLCHYGNGKDSDDPKWNDDNFTVAIEVNKIIQWVVDEFRDKRIALQGTEEDWFDYWLDWNNMRRIDVIDPTTNQLKGRKWVRDGRNHRASATTFWRVGISRFTGNTATFFDPNTPDIGTMGIEVLPNGEAQMPGFFG